MVQLVQLKPVSVLLVCVFVNSVSCGRLSYHPSEDEISQDVHSLRKRSPFLGKFKKVIGHIADHLDIHHRHNANCAFKHSPQDSYHGHDFKKDFPIKHEPGWFLGPQPPHVNKNNPEIDYHDYGSSQDTHSHHPSFPFEEDHGFRKDKPYQKPKNPGVNKNFPTDLSKKQDNENKALTTEAIGHEADDKDYPVSDFDKNKEKNGRNPFEDVNGTVNLESDFSGTDNEGKNVENGSRDWVIGTEDDIENTGGQVPSTAQIDIRFGKG